MGKEGITNYGGALIKLSSPPEPLLIERTVPRPEFSGIPHNLHSVFCSATLDSDDLVSCMEIAILGSGLDGVKQEEYRFFCQ